MKIDLEEGDTVQQGRVVSRYYSSLGVESVKIDPLGNPEDMIIKEMNQFGWIYHFTRDSTGLMYFRDEDNWSMEAEAGNT